MRYLRYTFMLAVPLLAGAAIWAAAGGSADPAATVRAQPPTFLQPLAPIPLEGEIPGKADLSGLGLHGDRLFLVSDETAHVQVLQKAGKGYTVVGSVPVGQPDTEVDLEAIAVAGDTVYAVGSHSAVRPKQVANLTYSENRARMTQILPPGPRDILARFPAAGGPAEISSLRQKIAADPVLAPFAKLPSKENGVDVEGLAVKGDDVYVGFRSPLLRGSFAPVMKTKFDAKSTHELRYLDLGGRGVRDLLAVEGGFLVLAGPSGEGGYSFAIYFWDGHDGLKGAEPQGWCRLLAELPSSEKLKPEGLTLVSEDATAYEILVVTDGAKSPSLDAYKLRKPSLPRAARSS